jgi:hypothetical protein
LEGQKGKIFIYYYHVFFSTFFRDEHCIYQLFWDEHSSLDWFKGTRLLHGFYDPNWSGVPAGFPLHSGIVCWWFWVSFCSVVFLFFVL